MSDSERPLKRAKPREDVAEEGTTRGLGLACVECRRRKLKCERQHPVCAQCQGRRECVYESIKRTPLTRKHLSYVEDRVERLEALVRRLSPSIDVEKELSPSASNMNDLNRTPDTPRPSAAAPTPRSSADPRPPITGSSSTSALPEQQPKDARGYEWDERGDGLNRGSDGMAALSLEPDGNGYFGFASGAALLRILRICAADITFPTPISASSSRPSDVSLALPPEHPSHTAPTVSDISRYIDAYFRLYHPQYPLLHEATFRAQFSELIARPDHGAWSFLLNVVLALGAFCAESDESTISDGFYRNAVSQLGVGQMESGSLTLVQAFTLLSNYVQKRNKPNAGAVYLGIAVRMAMGLGLHRELPGWRISPFEREVRRRVWWVLYIFDSGATITFGRPMSLPEHGADVHLVLNIPDLALTAATASSPPPSDEPTIYSSLLMQSSFHTRGNLIYSRVISSPPPSASETLDLDAELSAWRAQLPEYFQDQQLPAKHAWLEFARKKLFWRYSNLRIILFRRFFLERALSSAPLVISSADTAQHAAADERCWTLCLAGAHESIVSISDYFRSHSASRLEWWYGLHFLFQACFIPLIALRTNLSSTSAGAWMSEIDMAKGVLQLAEAANPLAGKCLELVTRLTTPPEALVADINVVAPASDFFSNLDSLDLSFLGDEPAHSFLPLADFGTLGQLWQPHA